MAKKKRRSGTATRAGTRPSERTSVVDGTRSVRPQPAAPGGPNRLERKEEARRQREAIRRHAARRRTLRRVAWIAGVGAVVAAIVYFALASGKGGPLTAEEQRLLTNAPAAATAAGCSAVQTIKPYQPESLDRAHIGNADVPTAPPLSSYTTTPPASGPHDPTTLRGGVYQDPPPITRSIHSLEHGAAVIWYDPKAVSPDDLTAVQTFFEKPGEDNHVIVAPYDYADEGDAGTLPSGKQMVMVAWHRMQTCDRLSLPVAFQFVHSYATTPKSAYKGEAPEAGLQI